MTSIKRIRITSKDINDNITFKEYSIDYLLRKLEKHQMMLIKTEYGNVSLNVVKYKY